MPNLRIAAIVCGLFISSNGFAQDLEREARWRTEVAPTLVIGDAVTINTAQGKPFFAIYTAAENPKPEQASTGIVIAHGLGVHPDHGLIGKLRVLLAEAGYATLSIQMPVMGKDVTRGEQYIPTFPEAAARIAAAEKWLRDKLPGSTKRTVLASHSMGAWMANVYFENTPRSPFAAWVCIGITGRIGAMGDNNLPILDLTGENDLKPTLDGAWLRKLKLMFFDGAKTVVIPKADHYFSQQEAEASRAIVAFVASLKK